MVQGSILTWRERGGQGSLLTWKRGGGQGSTLTWRRGGHWSILTWMRGGSGVTTDLGERGGQGSLLTWGERRTGSVPLSNMSRTWIGSHTCRHAHKHTDKPVIPLGAQRTTRIYTKPSAPSLNDPMGLQTAICKAVRCNQSLN